MRYTIIPKDSSKAVNVRNDTDFKDILRERVGNDAAEYYETRIKEFEEIFDQLKTVLQNRRKSSIRDEMLGYLNDITEDLFD